MNATMTMDRRFISLSPSEYEITTEETLFERLGIGLKFKVMITVLINLMVFMLLLFRTLPKCFTINLVLQLLLEIDMYRIQIRWYIMNSVKGVPSG